MSLLAVILGLLLVVAYFWAAYERDRAELYAHQKRAFRAAARDFMVEVIKLERRNAYLERRRMWATRRAWRKRSGYRSLGGVWQVH